MDYLSRMYKLKTRWLLKPAGQIPAKDSIIPIRSNQLTLKKAINPSKQKRIRVKTTTSMSLVAMTNNS